jgi:hypothetical protein
MTKARYLEMCEALGSTPKASETPVDTSELPVEVQLMLEIYDSLLDNWDYVNGNYYGKRLEGITEFFNMHLVAETDRLFYLRILSIINNTKVSLWHKKQNAKSKK